MIYLIAGIFTIFAGLLNWYYATNRQNSISLINFIAAVVNLVVGGIFLLGWLLRYLGYIYE